MAATSEVCLELFVLLVDTVTQLGFIVGDNFTSYCFLFERGQCEVTGWSVTLFQHLLVTLKLGFNQDLFHLLLILVDTLLYCPYALILAHIRPRTLYIRHTPSINSICICIAQFE